MIDQNETWPDNNRTSDPVVTFWEQCRSGIGSPDLIHFLSQLDSDAANQRLSLIRLDQRRQWQLGNLLPVEQYLSKISPRDCDQMFLIQLVFFEDYLRKEFGEQTSIATYQNRFPAIATDLKNILLFEQECHPNKELQQTWLQLRAQWQQQRFQGLSISLEQFCRNNSELLPHLMVAIERDHFIERFCTHEKTLQIVADYSPLLDHQDNSQSFPIRSQLTQQNTLSDVPPPYLTSGVEKPFISQEVDLSTVPGYEILGQLGRGGMGVVYRARDLQRNRIVALKTLLGIDHASLSRLKHEFRVLANVVHPNLVPLYELISDGRIWFFTMQLIEGVDLLRFIRLGNQAFCNTSLDLPPVSLNDPHQFYRLQSTICQLTDALLTLHAAEKLHRDIKPSNILVNDQGKVFVLDFGLVAEMTHAGMYINPERGVFGTVAYMSPEQAAGQSLTPATDWYSVGVILYEALTGKLPFTGTIPEILAAKSELEPVAPQVGCLGIPDYLNSLTVQLLRRDPSQRPSGKEILRRFGCEPIIEFPQQLFRSHPLIGRSRYLAQLRQAFDRACHGRTVLVHLAGRSGMGKTTLIRTFLEQLKQENATILHGQCYEKEFVPYKAFDSLIDELAHNLDDMQPSILRTIAPTDVIPLVRVFPSLHRLSIAASSSLQPESDLQDVRRRAFVALRQLFSRMTRRAPLVLFLDDLQWGDLDSWTLYCELFRPPDPPSLLCIGAYRDEEVQSSPFLSALLSSQNNWKSELECTFIQLDALSPAESRDLAFSVLDRTLESVPRLIEEVVQESAGNPLFLSELAEHLRQTRDQGGSDPVTSLSLGEVLWSRVKHLPSDARNFLELLSVAGRPLMQSELVAAAGLQQDEWRVVAQLRSLRMIRTTGAATAEEIVPYHDRIRETVIEHLSSETIQLAHRRLATTLETSVHATPEALAFHFMEAKDHESARKYLIQAAEKATSALAFDRAIHFYKQALDLQHNDASTPTEKHQRAHWEHQLGEVYYLQGFLPEAMEHFIHSVALIGFPEPQSTGALLLGTIVQLIQQVCHRLGLLPTSGRVPFLPHRLDQMSETALSFERLSHISYYNSELLFGLYRTLRTLNLAERTGAIALLARSYANMCLACSFTRLDPLARMYARLAEPLARRSGHHFTVIQVLNTISLYHLGQGRWQKSSDLVDETHHQVELFGTRRQVADTVTMQAMVAAFLGRFEVAKEHFVHLLTIGQTSRNVLIQAWSFAGLGECLFRQGRTQEACDFLLEAAELLRDHKDHTEEIRTQGLLAAGYFRRGLMNECSIAVANIEQLLLNFPSVTCSTLEGFAGLAEVQFARWQNNPGTATQIAAKRAFGYLWRYAQIFPIGKPRALLYRGFLERMNNRIRAAQITWQRSLREARRLQMPIETAFVMYVIGRHSADSFQRTNMLKKALAVFKSHGMRYEQNLVEQVL